MNSLSIPVPAPWARTIVCDACRGPSISNFGLVGLIPLGNNPYLVDFRSIQSELILRRCQPAIELIGECLSILGVEVRRSPGDLTSSAQFIQ